MLTTLALASVVLVACNGTSQGDDAKAQGTKAQSTKVQGAKIQGAIFGDGMNDPSPVIAEVNGYKITQRMLDIRYEELSKDLKQRYQGDDGKRLLVLQMADEVLRLREAERRKLESIPDVARVLISQRRLSLDAALTNALIADKQPSVEEIREYYQANKDKYVRLGTMHAAHIECATESEARAAYNEAKKDGAQFAKVVEKFSRNQTDKASGGDLGWFNKAGFVPAMPESRVFTTAVWDLEKGVNPPVEVAGKWHVVNVLARQYDRPQTLEEAYDTVQSDMLPAYQARLVKVWVDDARANAKIEYFGDYRPGKGRTARELLDRAMSLNDAQQKMDLYQLILTDFPDDELADDTLFLAANQALDAWGDRVQASGLLSVLLKTFPGSEYAADAQYMIDNMARPGFTKPKSIEDLRAKP
jgi:parvulin-like peptidyl-prolyl isomerase